MKFQICKWLFVIVKLREALRHTAKRKRGGGGGAAAPLMDWKGMCLSSKRLPVNKDSPADRPAWRGAVLNSSIFSQVLEAEGSERRRRARPDRSV